MSSTAPHMIKPEVLAPAGSPEALQAAIHAGADAVYLGVTDYNARVRARNFTLEELPETIAEAHRWGTRVYVTFNTLVFSDEESAARHALAAIIGAGADALIVQDLGVVRWVRAIAPELPVHASTQMTVTSADGIAPLARLGVRRVILGRELSIPEIARIRAATEMELEVFVHGALCVSYSGQCLSSEAWGGRSANRGQCAQACRLPYELMVDDRRHDLGDRAYLLSPRDLEGYRRIPELVDVGIATVKIEGRMKGPEYVSAATRLYRSAVDRAWQAIVGPDSGAATRRTDRDDLEGLAWQTRQVFSRGASEGFLGGVNHQILVDGRTRSSKRHRNRAGPAHRSDARLGGDHRTNRGGAAGGRRRALRRVLSRRMNRRSASAPGRAVRTDVRIRFQPARTRSPSRASGNTCLLDRASGAPPDAASSAAPTPIACRSRNASTRNDGTTAGSGRHRSEGRLSDDRPSTRDGPEEPADRSGCRSSSAAGRHAYALAALDLDLDGALPAGFELNRIRRALIADLESLRSTVRTTPPGLNDDDASSNRHVAARTVSEGGTRSARNRT
ncbi:MAG: peptidase U32 family protein [Candidatus Eisenbacteria bacterium]